MTARERAEAIGATVGGLVGGVVVMLLELVYQAVPPGPFADFLCVVIPGVLALLGALLNLPRPAPAPPPAREVPPL